MELEDVYCEIDNKIIKLCNDVNRQMEWMKMGVNLCAGIAFVALVISFLAIIRGHP